MTVTLIALLKRRPGMSKADFIAYYEAHHRRIGEEVLSGYASRYMRRFLHPVDGTDQDHDFDVVTEIEFPDQAAMDAYFVAMQPPEIMDRIIADEEQVFDRSRTRLFTVEEHGSALPEPGAHSR